MNDIAESSNPIEALFNFTILLTIRNYKRRTDDFIEFFNPVFNSLRFHYPLDSTLAILTFEGDS